MKGKKIVRIAILMGLMALIPVLVHNLFYNIDNIPTGALLSSYDSPNQDYTINVFLCSGNATNADSIRVEAIGDRKKRNIYWQYKKDSVAISWLSDYVIQIDGVSIDVRNGSYDWRR